ncbi:hypothetical protein [Flavobacterium sp. GP15]|uniref:hypothetical protein n=1 Tax=Flavobacterium sp. GP15 TaxID=2758567 RepID=UPI00165D5D81|nr:hypothetical protein [Flavobacterium sp. GP15]
MTQEQIDFVTTITDLHLSTFLNLKEKQFNNKWTDECERLFLETRIGITQIAENFLLQPVRTLNPTKLIFTSENEPCRAEIANMTSKIFNTWKQQN